MMTDTDERAARILDAVTRRRLNNAGLAVVDAEWASKAEALCLAASDWIEVGTLLNIIRMRKAAKAFIHPSGSN